MHGSCRLLGHGPRELEPERLGWARGIVCLHCDKPVEFVLHALYLSTPAHNGKHRNRKHCSSSANGPCGDRELMFPAVRLIASLTSTRGAEPGGPRVKRLVEIGSSCNSERMTIVE